MSQARMKFEPPALSKSAFNCPHCQVLTTQYWFACHAEPLKKNSTPRILVLDAELHRNLESIKSQEEKEDLTAHVKRTIKGLPFMWANRLSIDMIVENVWFSRCYECDEVSIWIHEKLEWPRTGAAPLPNPDLPPDLQRDYNEASQILDLSPRGAVALLRLLVQKLCQELGEPGKHIDADIASLVKKGLDVKIQQALDIVRVVGNNAVHPGQIDLRDDRATAERLFKLINLIADRMISEPKHIAEMYSTLPASSLGAIAKRDAPGAPPKKSP